MLHDKPKNPSDAAVAEYKFLAGAVADAMLEFGRADVTTRQVYWMTPYQEGGGMRSAPNGPVEDKPLGYYDKQRVARFVRRLKKAAQLDVIDGHRVGSGFEWRTRSWTYSIRNQFVSNATFPSRPTNFTMITGPGV